MNAKPRFIDLSFDKRLLLVISEKRKIKIYDLARKIEIWEYEDHDELLSAEWVIEPSRIVLVSTGNVRMVDLFLDFNKR